MGGRGWRRACYVHIYIVSSLCKAQTPSTTKHTLFPHTHPRSPLLPPPPPSTPLHKPAQVAPDSTGQYVVALTVTNAGSVASDVVVLGFVALTTPDPQWAYLSPPNRNLGVFTRVSALAPGASQPLLLPMDVDALTVVDSAGLRVFPSGLFTLTVDNVSVPFVVA